MIGRPVSLESHSRTFFHGLSRISKATVLSASLLGSKLVAGVITVGGGAASFGCGWADVAGWAAGGCGGDGAGAGGGCWAESGNAPAANNTPGASQRGKRKR